jgi:hypothetical protein
MTNTVTPWAMRHLVEYQPDPARGPATWLMRGWTGVAVTWPGFVQVDIWDENALRCPCPCHHEPPALGHPYEPYEVPPADGPDTWPRPRDLAPPPPRPVPDGRQLDILTALDPARSTP